jgi:transposase
MDKKPNFKKFVGIDISKKTLDICILDADGKILLQEKIENSSKDILSFSKRLIKMRFSQEDTLICYENTGVYTMLLNSVLSSLKWNIWVVPAIEIKRSKGLTRGKNDKSDAKDIALYALANQFKFNPYSMPSEEVQKLKMLQSEREKIVECIKQMSSTSENKEFYPKELTKSLMKINESCIKDLKKNLDKIEFEIKRIIDENEKLKQQMTLITSIPGIGKQTALYLIIASNQFQNFKEWRKMACYAGIAPFEYSSGTSIRGRNKVSHLADKRLKSLLHMCALVSIRNNKELKSYYERKKEEGKHSMLVLNNVKCKIIARVFAVINREKPFIDTYKWAA